MRLAVTKSRTGTWDLGLGTRGLGDSGTWGLGDVKTRGRGDSGTWELEDLGTWGRRDVGTWVVGTRGRGDSGRWDARTSELGDAYLTFALN